MSHDYTKAMALESQADLNIVNLNQNNKGKIKEFLSEEESSEESSQNDEDEDEDFEDFHKDGYHPCHVK